MNTSCAKEMHIWDPAITFISFQFLSLILFKLHTLEFRCHSLQWPGRSWMGLRCLWYIKHMVDNRKDYSADSLPGEQEEVRDSNGSLLREAEPGMEAQEALATLGQVLRFQLSGYPEAGRRVLVTHGKKALWRRGGRRHPKWSRLWSIGQPHKALSCKDHESRSF